MLKEYYLYFYWEISNFFNYIVYHMIKTKTKKIFYQYLK